MLGHRAPYPVYTRHTRREPGLRGLPPLRRQASQPAHHTAASTLCFGHDQELSTLESLSDILTQRAARSRTVSMEGCRAHCSMRTRAWCLATANMMLPVASGAAQPSQDGGSDSVERGRRGAPRVPWPGMASLHRLREAIVVFAPSQIASQAGVKVWS